MHGTPKGKIVACGLRHAHVAATRYAVKLLLKDLWIAWRRDAREESAGSGNHAASSEDMRLDGGICRLTWWRRRRGKSR